MSTKSKAEIRADAVSWRRNKALELKARGLNQSEIARELQISEASISQDMAYLRNQAKQQIKQYVTEQLPEQYQLCLCALDTVIKRSYEMIGNAHDQRSELLAMEMYQKAHTTKLELLSNAATIDQALEFIRSKQHGDNNKCMSYSTEIEHEKAAILTPQEQGKQSVF